MSTPKLIELSEVKYRELQIKARGFDIMRELEALQLRTNQLVSEKDLVMSSLKELYDFVKQNAIIPTEPEVQQSNSSETTNSESKQSLNSNQPITIDKPVEKKITRNKTNRD